MSEGWDMPFSFVPVQKKHTVEFRGRIYKQANWLLVISSSITVLPTGWPTNQPTSKPTEGWTVRSHSLLLKLHWNQTLQIGVASCYEKTWPSWSTMRPQATFSFYFSFLFTNFSYFFFSFLAALFFIDISLFLFTKLLWTNQPTDKGQRCEEAKLQLKGTVRLIEKQCQWISLFQRFWRRHYGRTDQQTNYTDFFL